MSVTAKQNIILQQGATFRLQVNWKDGSRRYVDLAGCTAKMQIRAARSAQSPVLLELTDGDGITLNSPRGRVDLVIHDEQTADLNFATGFYDLLITFTNGDVRRLLEGRVTFSPSATVI